MDYSAWVVVGRLLRTRGRVGELLAEIDSQQPGRAERLHHILLRKSKPEVSSHGPKPGSGAAGSAYIEREFDVERVWLHGGRPVFQLKGIASISDAEPWEGAEILVPPAERVQPEPGEYLHGDLIGCAVVDATGVLGQVVGVEDLGDAPGAAPTLIVKTTSGKEALIPFARALCPEIDVAAKRIRVELPEGLLDL